MDVKQAYLKALELNNNTELDLCYECNNLFIFGKKKSMAAQIAVDKKTGDAKFFQPFEISVDEFNKRKMVTDFK